MRRLTFTSALLIARELEQSIPPGYPRQSQRGDEHLCAVCAKRPGVYHDREARLVCELCR